MYAFPSLKSFPSFSDTVHGFGHICICSEKFTQQSYVCRCGVYTSAFFFFSHLYIIIYIYEKNRVNQSVHIFCVASVRSLKSYAVRNIIFKYLHIIFYVRAPDDSVNSSFLAQYNYNTCSLCVCVLESKLPFFQNNFFSIHFFFSSQVYVINISTNILIKQNNKRVNVVYVGI